MPRQEFSRKTKRDRFAHCGGKCEGCGVKLRLGRFAYDHDTPTGWLGGDNSFENCRVLCSGPGSCHAAKTKAEAPQKAKSDRIRDRRIGALTSRHPLQSRGFDKSPPQHRATKPLKRPLPQRQTP